MAQSHSLNDIPVGKNWSSWWKSVKWTCSIINPLRQINVTKCYSCFFLESGLPRRVKRTPPLRAQPLSQPPFWGQVRHQVEVDRYFGRTWILKRCIMPKLAGSGKGRTLSARPAGFISAISPEWVGLAVLGRKWGQESKINLIYSVDIRILFSSFAVWN